MQNWLQIGVEYEVTLVFKFICHDVSANVCNLLTQYSSFLWLHENFINNLTCNRLTNAFLSNLSWKII